MKIAFYMMGGEAWPAGSIYLRNLFFALRQTYGKEMELYLLAPPEQHDIHDFAYSIKADGVILYNIFQPWTLRWAIDGTIRCLLMRDIVIEGVLRKHRIDALFGPALIYKYPKIATLSWLPDFQHIHLPDMFSDAERFLRDRTFLRSAKLAIRVILPIKAARKDFESFAPMYAHKVRVLHPISYVPQSIYHDSNLILNLYHLPEKFVYLPNQFWKHKNHELVFQVVKIVKERGVNVSVVCTGPPVDYRHPAYFGDLWQKLSQWNIRDQVIYLGFVPHKHVLLLMRQSICVLTSSLFEGWGITVDEAQSIGKQVLLSDIPAHREQNAIKATFFNPYDCEDLAEKLVQVWLNTAPGPDIELEIEARQRLPDRLRAYAEAFASVAQEAIKEVRG